MSRQSAALWVWVCTSRKSRSGGRLVSCHSKPVGHSRAVLLFRVSGWGSLMRTLNWLISNLWELTAMGVPNSREYSYHAPNAPFRIILKSKCVCFKKCAHVFCLCGSLTVFCPTGFSAQDVLCCWCCFYWVMFSFVPNVCRHQCVLNVKYNKQPAMKEKGRNKLTNKQRDVILVASSRSHASVHGKIHWCHF